MAFTDLQSARRAATGDDLFLLEVAAGNHGPTARAALGALLNPDGACPDEQDMTTLADHLLTAAHHTSTEES